MADFFGYNKPVNSANKIASSEGLTLTGLGGSSLLQNVRMEYRQQIKTIFAMGTAGVFFVGGQSQGTLDFEKMAECGKLIDIPPGQCGKIGGAGLTVVGTGDQCGCAGGGGGFTIAEPWLEAVTLTARAGEIPILVGGRLMFTDLKPT